MLREPGCEHLDGHSRLVAQSPHKHKHVVHEICYDTFVIRSAVDRVVDFPPPPGRNLENVSARTIAGLETRSVTAVMLHDDSDNNVLLLGICYENVWSISLAIRVNSICQLTASKGDTANERPSDAVVSELLDVPHPLNQPRDASRAWASCVNAGVRA